MKNIKKILGILLVLSTLLTPQMSTAATTVAWNTPTITTGWILPNLVNGVNQAINAVAGIFTSASSTFAGTFRLPSLSQGNLYIGSGGVVQTGATTSVAVSSPLTVTGTLGALIGGSNSTINCQTASGSQAGCLASADFTTFNGKQAAGNYITGITGDLVATGPGSVAGTLATVNGNVGSFTCSNTTVNGKGLTTAVSNGGCVTSVSGTTNRITSSGGATPAIDISASYVGQASITTVGTLSAGAVPASLVTAGTFGAGNYVFPGTLTATAGLATFGNASSSVFSTVYGSTTDARLGRLTISNISDGCLNITSGLVGSTGSACGAGGSGAAYPFQGTNNSTSTLTGFTGGLFANASSTLNNFTFNLATGTAATTTNFASGTICLATDCRTAWPSAGGGAYPFALTGNATSTLTQFNGGLTAYASSTIGNGTLGLSVNGPATTTGNLNVRGTFNHFGSGTSNSQCDKYGAKCVELADSENNDGGVYFQVENTSNGTKTYSGYTMLNDIIGTNSTNYAGMFLNGSNNTSTTFGTANSVGNLMQVANLMGPMSFQASSTGAANLTYYNWLVNGVNTDNEVMRLTNAGNLGIGTTSPFTTLGVVGESITTGTTTAAGGLIVGTTTNLRTATLIAPLDVNVGRGNFLGNAIFDANAASNLLVVAAHGASANAGINAFTSGGSSASPTATQSNDNIYFMGGRGYTGTAYATGSSAVIQFRASGNQSNTNAGTYMSFETTPQSGVTRNNFMYYTNEGNLLMGTTSFAFIGGTSRLDVTSALNGTVPILSIRRGIGTATTSVLTVDANGSTTVAGLGISSVSTSTSNVGFNITGGCYAISGTCVGGSGGGSITGTGFAGMMTAWSSGSNIIATSTPLVSNLISTSSATSSFAGPLSVGLFAPSRAALFSVATSTGSPRLYVDNVNGNVAVGTDLSYIPNNTFSVTKGTTAQIIINPGAPANSGDFQAGNIIGTITAGDLYIGPPTSGAAGSYKGVSFNTGGLGWKSMLEFNSGAATTNLYLVKTGGGIVGVGSSTPFAYFAINPQGNLSPNQFVVGSSTATAFIIQNSGRVGIATTSPQGMFAVNGTVFFDNISSATSQNALCINPGTDEVVTAGGNTCVTSSQYTKHNITPITTGEVDALMKLQAVSYIPNDDNQKRYGFVAEEVAKIDPAAVEYAKEDIAMDGHLFKKGEPISVDYLHLTGLIVPKIQAMQKQIDSFTGTAKRSVEENYQWIAIALLFGFVIRQQYQIKNLKK